MATREQLKEALATAQELSNATHSAIRGVEVGDYLRDRIARLLWQQAIQDFWGFLVLTEHRVLGTARIVPRPQIEAVVRGAWVKWFCGEGNLDGIEDGSYRMRPLGALIQDVDRFDVILANPPFGGKERKEVQQNFPIKTGETAFLFLQHFIKSLRAGGRAAIVIKNTFLSNNDNASTSIRKMLLESCNLHTVLDMPSGTFQGAGVKTVVLFFEKGAPTRKVWFYQLNPGRNMGKTNPLNDDDLGDFIERQKRFADSAQSWLVDVAGIDTGTCDLSVKNPNGGDEVALRTPQDILAEIAALDAESAEVLSTIRGLVAQ